MISVGNTNSSRSLVAPVTGENSPLKNNTQHLKSTIEKQVVKDYGKDKTETSFNSLLIKEKNNQSLKKYTALAITYQEESATRILRSGVSYSSVNAINQYVKTKNADFIENTAKLLGFSIYV